jgi:hypothetical protein
VLAQLLQLHLYSNNGHQGENFKAKLIKAASDLYAGNCTLGRKATIGKKGRIE